MLHFSWETLIYSLATLSVHGKSLAANTVFRLHILSGCKSLKYSDGMEKENKKKEEPKVVHGRNGIHKWHRENGESWFSTL